MRSTTTRRSEQVITSQYVTPQGICDPEQAKAIAKKLFDLYDRDRNGIIDGPEVSPMLVDAYRGMSKAFNPTQADVDTFVQVLDVNRDGKITYQDVENYALRILAGIQPLPSYSIQLPPQRQYNRMVEERLEVARRLFKKFDVTQCGFLTRNEVPGLLRETYKQLNIEFEPTPQDVQAWMDMTDTDCDGKVALQDFEQSIIRSLQEQGISLY
ncbi:unnamed protein product [Paramecium octaurelia]|uniref:EF-hand domain-containing protein n=1 Tax=Paramecium octaurelia TaxID=43137 RepID=A0A8S1YJJ2_PAROT|nr:unnamed protein product [Paramecium octaurelia]